MEPVQKKRWVDDRLLWDFLKEKVIYKPLSKDISWWHTLGALALFLLISQVVTGIILACNFVPTIESAYSSTQYIQNEMVWGWLIRGIHHWGSNLMLIVVMLHMARVFFDGGYKKPNEVTWIAGVFLLGATMAMALTGYILPWTDISYWAVTILATTFDYIPVVGSWIANVVGGKQTGGVTLGRYFAFHIVLIPLGLAGFLAIHILMIQIHGEKGPPPKKEKGDVGTQPFFPYQLAKDVIVVILAFVLLIVLAKFAGVHEAKQASPLADIDSVPKPEWFILFGYEIIKMFEGKLIIIALAVVPVIGGALVLLLPFYDRNEERAYLKRPIAIASGVSAIIIAGYLTLIAHISSPLPGKFFAPDRTLEVKELAGMAIFEKNVCYCCHSIKGVGMKHAPDLWKVGAKRDKKFVEDLLKDPDKVLGKGKMIKYYFDKYDLDALVSYVTSIDLMKYNIKTVEPSVFRSTYKLYRSGIGSGKTDEVYLKKDIVSTTNDKGEEEKSI
ncbi:MAG: cytochrome b N-terminal domain-containing protein [Spirochaetota bacterium]|nr:cytochrome b N-terminal domain-containing protein [Spirochaetota bacterium]